MSAPSVDPDAGYTAAQVRAAEAPHLAAGEHLMQRAAEGLAAAVLEGSPSSALLLVGSGNNGGDTLYAGARLARAGVDVVAVFTTDHPHPQGLDAALDAGVQRRELDLAAELFSRVDVVLDGILGTGATPPLREPARGTVAALLATGAHPRIVAVDLPSGVHPDDGSVPDDAILTADLTVTFGAVKAGLLLAPGRDRAGILRLIDLGLGRELIDVEPVIRRSTADH